MILYCRFSYAGTWELVNLFVGTKNFSYHICYENIGGKPNKILWSQEIESTFTWEAKWIYIGLRFQTGVKTSSVHMRFHFGCISKRPVILMDMCKHFISSSVYMIFYHPKWSFISVKIIDMKSIPALSFKRTCSLNATSNESALIHFVSGKFCSHENLMLVWNLISIKMTNMKSIPFWVSFRLNSCEHK